MPPDETIVVRKGHGLPYSKGLMAQALSATALSQERSFELARLIERRLAERGQAEIDVAALHALAEEVLVEQEGELTAARYRGWRRLDRLDRPLVVLIGGTTGVGKSTLATMLAARLGVNRVIATDVIRQVLRAFFTIEAMPTVHSSAFEAGGVHPHVRDRCVLVEALVVVDDPDLHRGHFSLRPGNRPAERYLASFDDIRRLQDHLCARAQSERVAIVDNENVDDALAQLMELVLDAVREDVK